MSKPGIDSNIDSKPEYCNHAPSTGKGHIPAVVHRTGGPSAGMLNLCGYCGSWIKPAHGTWVKIAETEANEIRNKLTNPEPSIEPNVPNASNVVLRDNAETCPSCRVNLQGDPIPAEQQYMYGATHWSRKIGIVDQDRDALSAWECPDCGFRWDPDDLLA